MKMNITNGSSAAGSLKVALRIRREQCLIVNDVLSCGPLKPYATMNEWRLFRQGFWDEVQCTCGHTPLNSADFERDFYNDYEELLTAKEIHIWVGTALSDQTMLCFLCFMFKNLKIDSSKVTIHQFSKRQDNDNEILGLGLLKPEEILANDVELPLSKSMSETLNRCWSSLCASTPEAYLKFIQQDNAELPFLVRSLRSLIHRYPDKNTGLTYWQKSLLRNTLDHGPKAAKIIGYTMGYGQDTLDITGDLYLFAILKKMASPRSPHPLIELNRQDGDMRETTAALTDIGEKVLAGELNALALNDLDDWVGGVHLSSLAKQVWVVDSDELVKTSI